MEIFFFFVFFFPSDVVGKQLLCLDGVRIVGKPQQLVRRTCIHPLGPSSRVRCSLFPGELVLSRSKDQSESVAMAVAIAFAGAAIIYILLYYDNLFYRFYLIGEEIDFYWSP